MDFNSNIMVEYARHNIHFRKSCAHFKIFHSVEILYCKMAPACVRACACVCVRACVCLYCHTSRTSMRLNDGPPGHLGVLESSGTSRELSCGLDPPAIKRPEKKKKPCPESVVP